MRLDQGGQKTLTWTGKPDPQTRFLFSIFFTMRRVDQCFLFDHLVKLLFISKVTVLGNGCYKILEEISTTFTVLFANLTDALRKNHPLYYYSKIGCLYT